jgi:hypothetical protein
MDCDVKPAVTLKRFHLTRSTVLFSIVVFFGFVLTLCILGTVVRNANGTRALRAILFVISRKVSYLLCGFRDRLLTKICTQHSGGPLWQ